MAISKDERKIFARNLQRYMDSVNITQKEVAEIAGVSQATVSEWLNCRKYPRMDKIQRLSDYFDALKSDLIEDKFKGSTEEAVEKALFHARVLKDDKLMKALRVYYTLTEKQQDAIIDHIYSYQD